MKCKLVFYCALVSCLKHVASLPAAFNVPRYPIPKNYKASRDPYARPQQYLNHQLYIDDKYKYPQYPQEYRNTNYDPNLSNRHQDMVPNNELRNIKRHPVQQKFKNSFAKRPAQNKWQNFNQQPVYKEPVGRFPDESLIVTQKPYYPQIPEIPPKPATDATFAKLSSPEKYLPVVKPTRAKDEKIAPAPLTPDRYFASSVNPVETYTDFDPKPTSKKNIIRKLMSNSRVRDMIGKSKSPSRYLVVYPNGTMERVNTLQSIAKKHPNYVLVNAGDLVVKENSNIEISTKPVIKYKQDLVTTPRSPPLNETKTQNDITTTTEKVAPETSSLTTELPLLPLNTTTLQNKVLLQDPLPKSEGLNIDNLPLETKIKTNNQSSPVEILPPVETVVLGNSAKKIEKPSDTSSVSSLKPINEDLEDPVVPTEKIMTLDIPPRTIVKVSGPAMQNIEEIPLDTNATDAPLLVEPTSSELDMSIRQTDIAPEAIPLETDTRGTGSLPLPLSSIVELKSDNSLMIEPSPKKKPNATDPIPLPVDLTKMSQDAKPIAETPPKETEVLLTASPTVPILADVAPKESKVSPMTTESKPPMSVTEKVEVTTENQLIVKTIAPTTTLPIKPVEDNMKPNKVSEKVILPSSLPPIEPKLQEVPKEQEANGVLPILPSIPIIEVTTTLSTDAPITETKNVITTTALPTTEKTPAAPVEIVTQTSKPITEKNDLTVLPGPMNSILINAPENNTLTRLPGHLDISKVNTVEKPLVWFKSNDESFWNKLGNGDDDLDIDILYYFQINSPPKIENTVSRTIYPNGTIIEEISRSVWESNADKPTVTKTTNVINPDGLTIIKT